MPRESDTANLYSQSARLIDKSGESGNLFRQPLTLVDALLRNVQDHPDQLACRFLLDGSEPVHQSRCEEWSYRQLQHAALTLALELRQTIQQALENQLNSTESFPEGQQHTVLLVCPAGLEFVASFFACLGAGVIVAPLQPPGRKQEAARWQHIVQDARPSAVLTLTKLKEPVDELLQTSLGEAVNIPVLEVDRLLESLTQNTEHAQQGAWILPEPEQIALLQYTSGSTSLPRGVQVRHANLIDNLEQIRVRFGHTPRSRGVIWLPPHHDMGLIGGILQPVYAGFPVTLMSPASFLRRPARWLQAISHFKATTSGGPNFAYEYCLRRCSEEDVRSLDLSSWQVAFNGAEAIRPHTLQRFNDRFFPQGFRSSAFLSCYGLAEGTLIVTSSQYNDPIVKTLNVSRSGLRAMRAEQGIDGDDALTLCSSGKVVAGTRLRIVNPESLKPLSDGQIGEIWIAGGGVAAGYRTLAGDVQDNFHHRLPESSEAWLRTGDLGFLHNEELYVSGRVKDLIILRGANYAPQDIELSVEQSHPRFMPSASAAFTVDQDHSEQLVVVQEVERGRWTEQDYAAALDAVRGAVSREHGLQVAAVVLVKPASLPKTPSGKVQRNRCRNLFETRQLNGAFQWGLSSSGRDADAKDKAEHPLVEEWLVWLRDYAETGINSQLMDERRSLSPSVLLDFGNRGLLGMQVPESYGGPGMGYRDINRVVQQLAAIDTTLALFVGLNNVLGIGPILHHGSEAMKQTWLPRLASGRELAAFALTEPGAGSNPNAMSSTAQWVTDNHWQINGQKIWSGSAAWAGINTVFARQQNEQGLLTGVSAFAIPKGRRGLQQGPEALTMGMRAMVQNQVNLSGVNVSHEDVLGQINNGMAVAQDAMNHGRLVIAAACIGGMKRCAQLMLRYASRRHISTGLLLDDAGLQRRLQELCSAINALSHLVDWMATRLDQGRAVPQALFAVCKMIGTEQFWRAADDLMQCLGGRGYIETNYAPQILRDARVLRIFEGPTETLAHYLAVSALRQPERLKNEMTPDVVEPAALQVVLDRVQMLPKENSNAWKVPAGEWLSWSLLQLMCRNAELCERDQRWLQRQIDSADQVLSGVADESETENQAELIAAIAAFQGDIGDVELNPVGEERLRDPLLKRDSSYHDLEQGNFTGQEPVHIVNTAANSIESRNNQSVSEIRQWISSWLCDRLDMQGETSEQRTIDPQRAFADMGLDSVLAVELAADLEERFPLTESLDPTMAWNYPTIEALSRFVAQCLKTQPEKTDWLKELQAELEA